MKLLQYISVYEWNQKQNPSADYKKARQQLEKHCCLKIRSLYINCGTYDRTPNLGADNVVLVPGFLTRKILPNKKFHFVFGINSRSSTKKLEIINFEN